MAVSGIFIFVAKIMHKTNGYWINWVQDFDPEELIGHG